MSAEEQRNNNRGYPTAAKTHYRLPAVSLEFGAEKVTARPGMTRIIEWRVRFRLLYGT